MTKPEAVEHKDPGWRKLAVWSAVFLLCAGMLSFGRVGMDGQVLDLPPNLMKVLMGVTESFFYVNGGIHAVRAASAAWKK